MKLLLSTGLALLLLTPSMRADDPAPAGKPQAKPAAEAPAAKPVPLNRQETVLIDRQQRKLILKTKVVLTAGLLEMLLCKAQTKEHESILAIDSDAYVIHAGLLALGVEPGTPVKYQPEFQPPTGPKIKIVLRWTDPQGEERTATAQEWIRHAISRYFVARMERLPEGFELPKNSELRYDAINKELLWFGPMSAEQRDGLLALSDDDMYQKAIRTFFEQSQPRAMQADFVFAGSGFYEPQPGERYYQAEAGNVICVANFGDAMIDVAARSTASNEGLQYEPYTERIPALETPVTVELIPEFPADEPPAPAR